MQPGRESFSLSASVSWLIVTMALMVDGRLWNYGEYQGILGEEEGPGESSNRVWHARVEFKVNPPHPLWPLTGLKTVQCALIFIILTGTETITRHAFPGSDVIPLCITTYRCYLNALKMLPTNNAHSQPLTHGNFMTMVYSKRILCYSFFNLHPSASRGS